MPSVDITAEDMVLAASAAAMRQTRAVVRRRVGNDHGYDSGRLIKTRLGDSWIGELGEMAVARYLDVAHTRGGREVDTGDVGEIEVRATEWKNGHLPVYKCDNDRSPFVLVVIDFSDLTAFMRGWLWGKEAKQNRWWDKDRNNPCYWINQKHLRSIDSLKSHLNKTP